MVARCQRGMSKAHTWGKRLRTQNVQQKTCKAATNETHVSLAEAFCKKKMHGRRKDLIHNEKPRKFYFPFPRNLTHVFW